MYTEKVKTGAIVIITGEYSPVKQEDKQKAGEDWFFYEGETVPKVEDHEAMWVLTQPIDFAA